MKLKIFTIDKDDNEVFTNFFIDESAIVGYWIIPKYVDEDIDLIVDSDEMNIVVGNGIMTIEVNQTLIDYLNHKLKVKL